LGIAEASNGRIVAQISKAPRALIEDGERHHHVVTHQWNLVLKGCAFHMTPKTKHTFVLCTDDFETLVIWTSADFGTEDDVSSTYNEDAVVPSTSLCETWKMAYSSFKACVVILVTGI
jgi:hypothetical protein